VACEAGLQPLADLLWQRCASEGGKEGGKGGCIRHETKRFVDGAAVPSVDDALAGARDILAGEHLHPLILRGFLVKTCTPREHVNEQNRSITCWKKVTTSALFHV